MNLRALMFTLCLGLAVLAPAEGLNPSAAAPGYRLLASLPLPGDKGWDLLSADSAGGRLYLSHGDQVLVVDTVGQTLLAQMGPFQGTHGIALAPGLNRGYITDGKADEVVCFNLKTLSITAHIKAGSKSDVVILDPLTERVWAFNADSGSVTIIQAGDNRVVKTLELGGAPEFAVADGKGLLWVNLEDKSQVLKIDSKKMEILARWDTAPGEEPSSLSFDAKHHRLFLGCHNRMAVVLDSDSGRFVARLPIGERVDGSAYDPINRLIFHSCGEGTLSVVHEDTPDEYSVIGNIATEKGARTIALDAKTHRLYLPSASFGPAPEPSAENPHPRPAMLPGSFHLLVFGKP